MSSSTTSEIQINSNANTVIALNTHASLKLNSSNFPAWHVQFNALLVGYDLIGYVDGTKLCPPTSHAQFNRWKRQDQLILHAIISSVDPSVITMLGNVKTSKQAWDILTKMFASKTRARIMHLKERLSRFTKGSKPMSEYLHGIKALFDELAIINSPLNDDDIVIHTLNGLGTEYREITAALRARENPIGFDDLHDVLSDFENYLKRDETPQDAPIIATAHAAHRGKPFKQAPYHSSNNRSISPGSSKRVICQFCDKPNHTAKVCYKLHGHPSKRSNMPAAHHARTLPPGMSDWISDSGATHHITRDLDHLHLSQPYTGSDQLIVGDGSGLPISNTGKSVLHTHTHSLQLSNVLHVPNISQNLLSISSLCKSNPISVEFFANHFLVKDLKTRAHLLKGLHDNGLYHLPRKSTPPQALTTTTSAHTPWHHILGHPSIPIMRHLLPS